jgi:hypothetical protein
MPFDPAQDALVVNSGEQAQKIIERYDVGRVYVETASGAVSYHIGDKFECDKLWKSSDSQTQVSGLLDPDSKSRIGRLVRGHCVVREVGLLPVNAYRVEQSAPYVTKATGSSEIHRREIQVVSPSGQAVVLEDGWAEPMPFIPFPMFGCYPDGGSSSCEGTFGLKAHLPLVRTDPVAAALKLKRVNWRQVEQGDTLHHLAPPSKAAVDAELAELDRMMAAPEENNRAADFDSLKRAPLSFSSRAPQLVAAIEKSYRSLRAADSGASMASLAASLPTVQWREYGPRLLKLYARSNWHWIREDDELLTRFGELGAIATPVLVEDYQGKRAAALIGLCLAGPEAKGASSDLLARVANPGTRLVNSRAEIITLARMGFYDQAMAANVQRGMMKVPSRLFMAMPHQPGPEWCSKLSMAS